MPKSRKRRQKSNKRKSRGRPRIADDLDMLPVMLAADEAELKGDAAGALDLVLTHFFDSRDRVFWRRERVERLMALVVHEHRLPRWAVSRWLLEQSLQQMDQGSGSARARALEIAAEVNGLGPLNSVDGERVVKLVDQDWVYRQLMLYEFGGLQRFLRRAPSDLRAGADRIEEWARTQMGGYLVLGDDGASTSLGDLATGREIEIANIGSTTAAEVGGTVIGRLVPCESGEMFETVPLAVPLCVAVAVAENPGQWIEVLRAHSDEVSTRQRFGFLSDIPDPVWSWVLLSGPGVSGNDPKSGDDLAEGWLLLARELLMDDPPPPEEVRAAACLYSAVLAPRVFAALWKGKHEADAELIRLVGERLAEPAATACRELSILLEDAA